jgi:chromosome segregation protein
LYLKKLELKGFKSFPNKTDILFKNGITSIVGPNGSGKSNISDAVRWVLGEQSIKSLRGDKLEDVIFAGSENKKHMNYCEVELTIDNKDNILNIDFSEVTIKRKAYKSGESEFFLNNKQCRLKDIRELLLDTGIGKDGYSIIEQGKVDEILSNSPYNRRKIFDEACGISKYRYKKQEAERNLKNTKENLDRINDIYLEIENQLKPVEHQRNKALKYIELQEDLKVLQVNNYIKEIEDIDRQSKEVNSHNEVLQEQLNSLQQDKDIREEAINNIQENIDKIEESINNSSEHINKIKSSIDKKDADMVLLNEKINNIENDKLRKESDIQNINKTIEVNKKSLENIKVTKLELSKTIKELTDERDIIAISSNDCKINLHDINTKIENLKDEVIELLNKKHKLSNKLSGFNANLDNINNRDKNIQEELKYLQKKIENKELELKNYINLKTENNDEIKKLNFNKNDEIQNYDNIKNNIKDIENKLNNTRLKINEYNSKLNIYVEMENQYEGFNKGVKEVLKNTNLEGIYGALGQLIKVSKQYEKAIEVALGGSVQNIITENENTAKSAIEYLKKNNLGRVTFLPINIIKENKIDEKDLKNIDGYSSLACEVVEVDNKYKNIIENILGRTILVKDIDIAIKLGKSTNHKYKIVTLDGDVFNPGGSLTGGSTKNTSNILSRKRLIEEYEINIKNGQIELINLEKLEEELQKDLDNNLNVINEIQDKLNKCEKYSATLNANIVNGEEEIKLLQESKLKFEKENKGLNENLAYTIEGIDKLQIEISNLETQHSQKQGEIKSLTMQSEKYKVIYEQDKEKLYLLNLELARNNQVYENQLKDESRIIKELEVLNYNLESYKNQIRYDMSNKDTLGEELILAKVEKENLIQQIKDIQEKFEEMKLQRSSLRNDLGSIQLELRHTDRQYMELKESMFKIQNRIERIKSNKENYYNKLWEDYEITFDEALKIKDENVIIDKKKIESLKNSIKKLGNVNIESIEKYEEIKERYDFYNEQKIDLEKSIKIIETLIQDLEENMKAEFAVNFDVINNNFKVVYSKLFGGGYGELRLSNPHNILESDIEITAQPPGKKMKNINLLSGGEKALTAISILFAIIIAKPTPFCILDEIEAPLDDANIHRFGEFLRELSSDTQFIIVTHRRGTMEASDYIYGVTMEEKAISKVVSLKLEQARELTEDAV